MKVLLDTHFLVWLAAGATNLRAAERAVIQDGGNEILASAASVWELRIKWTRRVRSRGNEGTIDPTRALTFAEDVGIAILPLSAADCAATLKVTIPHHDPFDEMLLIHAQQIGARLLTRDGEMRAHPLVLQL